MALQDSTAGPQSTCPASAWNFSGPARESSRRAEMANSSCAIQNCLLRKPSLRPSPLHVFKHMSGKELLLKKLPGPKKGAAGVLWSLMPASRTKTKSTRSNQCLDSSKAELGQLFGPSGTPSLWAAADRRWLERSMKTPSRQNHSPNPSMTFATSTPRS